MGPTALLPLRRKTCGGFFRPKNPTASTGCEPANLGTKDQHATSRQPQVIGCTLRCIYRYAGNWWDIYYYRSILDFEFSFSSLSSDWLVALWKGKMFTTPLQITNIRFCTGNPLSLWQEASSHSVYLFLIVSSGLHLQGLWGIHKTDL
jgi:hypothetical protein